MRRLWLIFAAAVILTVSPARAQDIGTPRIEVGGSLSVVVPLHFEDGPFALGGGGPRLGLNISRRLSIETMAEALGPVEGSDSTGFYLTQIKLRFRESGRARALLLTLGAAGGFAYNRFGEQRSPRLDGSFAVHPAYRRFRVQGPNTVVAGIERAQRVGRHASGFLALQGFIGPFSGVAVRAAAGLSFGLGRRQ